MLISFNIAGYKIPFLKILDVNKKTS